MTVVPLKYIYQYVMHPETVSPLINSMINAWFFGGKYDHTLGTPFDTARYLVKMPFQINFEDMSTCRKYHGYIWHIISNIDAYFEYLRMSKKYGKTIFHYLPDIKTMTPMQIAMGIRYNFTIFKNYLDRITDDFDAYMYVMEHVYGWTHETRNFEKQFSSLKLSSNVTKKFNALPEYIRVILTERRKFIFRGPYYKLPYLLVSDHEARKLVGFPKYAYRYLMESYKNIKPSTRKILLNAIRHIPKYYMKVTVKHISTKKRNIKKILDKDITTVKQYLYYNSIQIITDMDVVDKSTDNEEKSIDVNTDYDLTSKYGHCKAYSDIIMGDPHLAFETYDHVFGHNYCIHEDLSGKEMTIYHRSMLNDIKTVIRYLGNIDHLWEAGLNLVMSNPRYCMMYLMAMQYPNEDSHGMPVKIPDTIFKYVSNNQEVLLTMLNMNAYSVGKNKYCKFSDLFDAAIEIDVPFTINIM